MKGLPRFQGFAFEVEGGWKYQINISIVGEGEPFTGVESKTIFKTYDDAILDMKKEIQKLCDHVQTEMTGKSTGQYVDILTNSIREWGDEH